MVSLGPVPNLPLRTPERSERKKDRTVKLLNLRGKSQIFLIFPIFPPRENIAKTQLLANGRTKTIAKD